MRIDVEAKIDRWILFVKKHYKASDTSLKKACLICTHVVGAYDGTTEAIAQATGRSVATVENWSHAGKLRAQLLAAKDQKKYPRELVFVLWDELSASHWWLAYDIQVKGFDAFFYLNYAMENKASGRDMIMEFKRDLDSGHARMLLERARISMVGLANEFLRYPAGLNDRQLDLCMKIVEDF